MALPPQLTQLAFAAGLDESQELEVLDPMTAFPVLRNGRQDSRGGYRTRLGFDDLTGTARFDGTTRDAGARLLKHGRRPCVIGTQLDVSDEANLLWQDCGRVAECRVEPRVTPNVGSNLLDAIVCNGVIVVAMHAPDPSGIDRMMVHVETVDGAVLRPPESVGGAHVTPSAFNGVLGTYGNIVIVVNGADDSANLAGRYLDCTDAASIADGWQTLGNVVTDKTTTGTGAYLFSSTSLDDAVAIAYVNDSAGASQVTVKLLTTAGVADTETVNTSSVKPNGVGLGGSTADRLYVAWNESTDVKMIGLNPTTLATVSTTATIMSSVSSPNVSCPYILPTAAGEGWLAVRSSNDTEMRAWTADTAMAAVGLGSNDVAAFFLAKPFLRDERMYGLFCPESGNTQRLAILGDWTDTNTSPGINPVFIRPIANLYPGQNRVALLQNYSHPLDFGDGSYGYALMVQRSASERRVAVIVRFYFDDEDRIASAMNNGMTYIATGGLLMSFGGSRVTEAGFLHAPPAPTLVGSGSGLTGTFSYVATYETIDDAGNLVTSGVSLPSSITVTDDSIAVSVPPLCLTSRFAPGTDGSQHRTRVAFWRTTDGGEPPYYFVQSEFIDTTAGGSGGSGFSDDMDDSTLVTRRLLYGTGSLPGTNAASQDHRAPPYADDVVEYAGMVVVLSGDVLWWSSQPIDGEAQWWSPAFTVRLPERGIGMAVQDGTLYVFSESRVYAIAGEPPSDNGAIGGLGSPRRLASDVGCIRKRSICVTGLGIFFQSTRGIELLDRSGAVTWIGERVQSTLAEFPTVTSAVLDERNSLVRISLTDGTNGRAVVFDLTLRAWVSVDDYTGTGAAEASVDACQIYIGGVWRYAWLGSNGVVWTEHLASDATAYLDGSTFVEREAQTAWFKAAGIQGKQFLNRLQVLERYATDHNLEVSLAYNYSTTWQTAREYTRAEIAALLTAGWPITQLRHDPHDDAECQSVRVRLVQRAPTGGTVGSGAGGAWLALTLDLTPRPGVFDVPEGAV